MTYTEWAADEAVRKSELVKKLQAQNKSAAEIVAYFDFENMAKEEPLYCPLYSTNTKCHPIEKLNCFFCGCPYFVYDDNGIAVAQEKTVYSTCTINCTKGSKFHTDTAIHQDCSKCTVPHEPIFAYTKAPLYMKENNE